MSTRLRISCCVARLLVASLLVACSEADDSATSDGGSDAPFVRQGSDRIPCDERIILEAVCQKCHGRPVTSGAPFSLVDRSDIVDATHRGTSVRELMIAQLESRHMPLSPETIDEQGRSQLLAWLYAGAPAVEPQACNLRDAGDESMSDAEDEANSGHEESE